MLLLYLVVVLAWCAALTGLEAAMGLTLRTGGGLASPGNYLDAIWHLATALVIAAPLRNRRLLLLLPLLSLGLDVDHVFGAYLPAPFPREAHDIVFLLIASAALYAIAGRFLAGASASAWITHVAVDGGAFPLLAPFASTAYVLPFPAVVFGIALAAAVAFAAARPIRAATDAREAVPIIVTVAALAVTLYFVAPGFRGFTGA